MGRRRETTTAPGGGSLERKIERLQDHYILCGLGRVGRLRMAHAILKPVPADFIEIATHNESLELEMGEIQIGPCCRWPTWPSRTRVFDRILG